ncbi:hypothetical protein ES703_122960 [subsurface metagenome]
MPELSSFKIALNNPYIGKVEGTWIPDKKERDAAWEMSIELVTRISMVELKPDEGLLREALSSLYTLFRTTREILRKYGPAVAKPKRKGNISFGYLAIIILNRAIRPVLAKWHPSLLDYESKRESSLSPLEHEKRWDKYEELRKELNGLRSVLIDYGDILSKVAKVPSLHITDKFPNA